MWCTVASTKHRCLQKIGKLIALRSKTATQSDNLDPQALRVSLGTKAGNLDYF